MGISTKAVFAWLCVVVLLLALCPHRTLARKNGHSASRHRGYELRPSFSRHRFGGSSATYWGQYDLEDSLKETCATESYDIIMISFLSSFGLGAEPVIDLAGHCDPSDGGCQDLSKEIESCHKRGVKIMLSIGGATGNYGLRSKSEAIQVAHSIWNDYLGGNGTSRPLGKVVLDGVDFDIENGTSAYYEDLATELRNLMDANRNKSPSGQFFLGAAPQCPFEDEFLGPGKGTALGTGLFDMVWVQFYNNPGCQYDFQTGSSDDLLKSWKQWTQALPSTYIFLGLPASPLAATDTFDLTGGFMPSKVLFNEVLPSIKTSPNYGGVMLWSSFYDKHDPTRSN